MHTGALVIWRSNLPSVVWAVVFQSRLFGTLYRTFGRYSFMTTTRVVQTTQDRGANFRLTIIALCSVILVGIYFAFWGRNYGLDFSVYRDASLSWLNGANPYLPVFTAHHLDFTYPPIALAFFVPSTLVSFQVAHFVFWIICIGVTTCAVAIVFSEGGMGFSRKTWISALAWTCISLLLLEPARSGLDYGQIEFVLMCFVVADLLVVPKGFRGIAIGIASALKLTPLIFVFALIACRDFKAALRALVTFVFLSALPWLFQPTISSTFWNKDVFDTSRVGQVAFIGNQSLLGVLHRPPFSGLPVNPLWLGISAMAVAAGAFIAWKYAIANQRSLSMIAIALGGLLASPISWSHHWVWVIVIPPTLLANQNKGVARPVRAMLWGVVAICVLEPYWWFSSGWQSDILSVLLPMWTMALLILWAGVALGQKLQADGPVGNPKEQISGT